MSDVAERSEGSVPVGRPRALIVGYDGSACAEAALAAASELAQLTGDRLVIAFGYEPSGHGEELAALRGVIRERGEEVTAGILDRAAALGIDAELALVPERPEAALQSLAAEHDARAIVVGSYGEGPLRSAILGSTPHKLLHQTDRPVLVVPLREDD
jgi:nucleotide-binding universal stress UspA family protein